MSWPSSDMVVAAMILHDLDHDVEKNEGESRRASGVQILFPQRPSHQQSEAELQSVGSGNSDAEVSGA